jgi:hypothetical protein
MKLAGSIDALSERGSANQPIRTKRDEAYDFCHAVQRRICIAVTYSWPHIVASSSLAKGVLIQPPRSPDRQQ